MNSGNKIAYTKQAKELVKLLEADQVEKREVARTYFEHANSIDTKRQQTALTENARKRSKRMLEILDEVGQPSLTNIGSDAAIAVAVLATHSSLSTMHYVLTAFTNCYDQDRENTHYQSLPAVTDWVLILERKPQRFGTQWLWDENKEPFLPTLEDFEGVNNRRAKYGIEPLRWPKSLAIPVSKQPWLRRPLSEMVMRNPTDKEYADFARNYID